MADVRFQGTLTGSDGSHLLITDATLTAPATGPTGPTGATGATGATGPSGPVIPAGANRAGIGTAVYPLAAINPTSSDYPGGRGVDQLVLYRAPLSVTATNPYGAEVPVTADTCGTINDRLTSLAATGTTIPATGYVLSGHGAARDFLLANATAGTQVTLSVASAPTGPTGASGPSGATGPTLSTRTLAVYLMLWPGSGTMANVPAQCNEVRLAFAQGSPPSLVGYTADGQAALVAKLAAFRARGGRVIISIGGAGGSVNLSARATFLTGFANMRAALSNNVDGIDWDVEASALNAADCLAISTSLKHTYGAGFRVCFAPNGGNVAQYLQAAVACHQAGALDSYGQQFYDAAVSVSAALGRLREAISAGIPASKLTVGNMIASDANHWTVTQCRDNYRQLLAAVPGLQGAYLWETHRAGTPEWASGLSPMVFG